MMTVFKNIPAHPILTAKNKYEHFMNQTKKPG